MQGGKSRNVPRAGIGPKAQKNSRTFWRGCFFMEVPPRFELGNRAFAELCLTTWLWHREEQNRVLKSENGASDEARTRYLHLGKVALDQMSYTRIKLPRCREGVVPPVGIEPTTRGFSIPCSTN